jgi:DNA-binding NtrC family response regulator
MRERALIAEDNDDMRDLLQEVLEGAGYETLVAANGRQALAHIEKESEVIDLVITDVRMPEMTGHELLAKARELRSEAPVIVITAFGSVEQAVEMVKAGAYQYLTKPFENRDLLRLAEEALERGLENIAMRPISSNRMTLKTLGFSLKWSISRWASPIRPAR